MRIFFNVLAMGAALLTFGPLAAEKGHMPPVKCGERPATFLYCPAPYVRMFQEGEDEIFAKAWVCEESGQFVGAVRGGGCGSFRGAPPGWVVAGALADPLGQVERLRDEMGPEFFGAERCPMPLTFGTTYEEYMACVGPFVVQACGPIDSMLEMVRAKEGGSILTSGKILDAILTASKACSDASYWTEKGNPVRFRKSLLKLESSMEAFAQSLRSDAVRHWYRRR